MVRPHDDGADVGLTPGAHDGLDGIAGHMASPAPQEIVPMALVDGGDRPVDPPHDAPVAHVAGAGIAGRWLILAVGVMAVVAHLRARFCFRSGFQEGRHGISSIVAQLPTWASHARPSQ
ncbi:hypothetical protein AMK68_00275 [candidate division KD3-62 bacterium DG_56]|uniref:Uncharacterized protein n=1 Tax=candidate division KD3-62 bacterium DG_56 TaxID=1704032 RepID=A0A0S7XR54_9BACT|nr:MAG: hypothetical protein AMK68_00275 [candidate division KD3-62 bacterium DG_56]